MLILSETIREIRSAAIEAKTAMLWPAKEGELLYMSDRTVIILQLKS